MKLEFREIKLETGGQRSNDEGKDWGKLSVVFLDTATDHKHRIRATVLLPNDAKISLGEIGEDACEQAAELLEMAAKTLRENSITELRKQEIQLEESDYEKGHEETMARLEESLKR